MNNSTIDLWVAISMTAVCTIFEYGLIRIGEIKHWLEILICTLILILFVYTWWEKYFKSKDLENFNNWYNKTIHKLI